MARKTAKEEAQDLKIEDFESAENLDNFESELGELEKVVQEVSRNIEMAPDQSEEKSFPKNEALVAYLEGNFIPYCKTCWEQHRTNFIDGSPICPVNYERCPRLNNP